MRELISNSSDACEKLRYVSQTDSKAPKTNKFQIRIHLNEKIKLISIKDNGIGMDDKDMQSNLGTIAKSGTEEFIKKWVIKREISIKSVNLELVSIHHLWFQIK